MVNAASSRNVVIIGASSNPDRYAHMAQELLMEKGYPVIPVSRKDSTILDVPAATSLAEITVPVDTVTLYVGPQRQHDLIPAIVKLHPRRVIFNPGTENTKAYEALEQAGIDYEEACTLVLLRTRQF